VSCSEDDCEESAEKNSNPKRRVLDAVIGKSDKVSKNILQNTDNDGVELLTDDLDISDDFKVCNIREVTGKDSNCLLLNRRRGLILNVLLFDLVILKSGICDVKLKLSLEPVFSVFRMSELPLDLVQITLALWLVGCAFTILLIQHVSPLTFPKTNVIHDEVPIQDCNNKTTVLTRQDGNIDNINTAGTWPYYTTYNIVNTTCITFSGECCLRVNNFIIWTGP
jgi:hypothetical protein